MSYVDIYSNSENGDSLAARVADAAQRGRKYLTMRSQRNYDHRDDITIYGTADAIDGLCREIGGLVPMTLDGVTVEEVEQTVRGLESAERPLWALDQARGILELLADAMKPKEEVRA